MHRWKSWICAVAPTGVPILTFRQSWQMSSKYKTIHISNQILNFVVSRLIMFQRATKSNKKKWRAFTSVFGSTFYPCQPIFIIFCRPRCSEKLFQASILHELPVGINFDRLILSHCLYLCVHNKKSNSSTTTVIKQQLAEHANFPRTSTRDLTLDSMTFPKLKPKRFDTWQHDFSKAPAQEICHLFLAW